MPRHELQAMFPNAKEDFLKLNATHFTAPPPPKRRTLGAITQDNYANAHTDSKIQNSSLKPDNAPTLGSPTEGKEKGMGRVIVRFVGYRVRLVDVDSYPASIKGCLDGLCKIGLIAGDQPTQIILETDQVKVASFAQEKTVIQIIYP